MTKMYGVNKNKNMKVFVFSGGPYPLDESSGTVVGIIEGESREEIIETFKRIYLRSERTFEDNPNIGYAEINTPDDYKKWLIFI